MVAVDGAVLPRQARWGGLAERREVIENVERGHADVAAHGGGSGGARVRERHAVVVARSVAVQSACRIELPRVVSPVHDDGFGEGHGRSEEHTSELQSLMRISYAVFCLKKKNKQRLQKKKNRIYTNIKD